MMFVVLAVSALLAAEALDTDMSAQEKKKTGVYKLSDNEKAALQKWVDNNYTRRSQPVQTSSLSEGHATLQENLHGQTEGDKVGSGENFKRGALPIHKKLRCGY